MRPFASEYAHFGHTSRGAQSKHFAVAGNLKIFFFDALPPCADNHSMQAKYKLLLRNIASDISNFVLAAPPFCVANAAALALLPACGQYGLMAPAIARKRAIRLRGLPFCCLPAAGKRPIAPAGAIRALGFGCCPPAGNAPSRPAFLLPACGRRAQMRQAFAAPRAAKRRNQS